MTIADEDLRAEMLLDAQDRAEELFAEIERSGMIRAGVGERALSDEILFCDFGPIFEGSTRIRM